LFLTLFLLLGAGDDAARFNSVGHRLMCMCGCNQVLLECNHVGCQYSDRMRAELVADIDRGDNDSLVLQDFVQKYGTTVLLAPGATGFDRLAWIMPYAALIAGIGTVCFVIIVWRKRPATGGPLPASASGSLAPDGLDQFRAQARRETEL